MELGASCSRPGVQLTAGVQVCSQWMGWQLLVRKWVSGFSTAPEGLSLRLEGSRSQGQPLPVQGSSEVLSLVDIPNLVTARAQPLSQPKPHPSSHIQTHRVTHIFTLTAI